MSSIAKCGFEGGGPGQYEGSLQFIDTNTPILGLYYDNHINFSITSLGPQLRIVRYSKETLVALTSIGNRSAVTYENNGFTIKPKGTGYFQLRPYPPRLGRQVTLRRQGQDKRGTVNIIICKVLAPPREWMTATQLRCIERSSLPSRRLLLNGDAILPDDPRIGRDIALDHLLELGARPRQHGEAQRLQALAHIRTRQGREPGALQRLAGRRRRVAPDHDAEPAVREEIRQAEFGEGRDFRQLAHPLVGGDRQRDELALLDRLDDIRQVARREIDTAGIEVDEKLCCAVIGRMHRLAADEPQEVLGAPRCGEVPMPGEP